MMKPRLGVNIDHVATLRQQRGEHYPSIETAARIALSSDADQITIHLREDRRHIQDADVPVVQNVCAQMNKLFNLEMGCADQIIQIAIRTKPDWICLVPEKREERTTEGGLALQDPHIFKKISQSVDLLKRETPKSKISLFVEASPLAIEASLKMNVDAVEIHTGDYARDALLGKPLEGHLKAFASAHKEIKNAYRGFHAGHGLTHESVKPLLAQGLFEEYNIGHWMIAQAVFDGLANVTKDLAQLIHASGVQK